MDFIFHLEGEDRAKAAKMSSSFCRHFIVVIVAVLTQVIHLFQNG